MRRLGDFIRQVDVRNKDLTVTNLVGLSIDKKYIPSVANIVGTDLSNYKVIRENQFACSLMQVSRDKKMPIAIYKGVDAIMSPAYPIFEVIDNSVLLPDYLQLWFVREEFDREATFYAIGGVRGSLEWGDFCDIKIPVPPIEDQLAIVARHKAIEHKIDVNHRLIATLEETARTIYRHTFIDNIDPENLPQGWRCVSINDVCNMSAGGDKPAEFSPIETEYFCIPIFSNSAEQKGLFGYTKKPTIKWQTVTISARGTIGVTFIRRNPYVPIVRLISLWPKTDKEINLEYLYFWLSLNRIEGDGAVQEQLTVPKLGEMEIILPPSNLLNEFQKQVIPLLSLSDSLYKETEILSQKLSAL